ncbi:MAG: zinc ribbon domain-containing protein [Patescibacteria group bacterium]|nr:zinc ribbon domain-containing protein [Patescibacteria group bacterium]MDD5490612.1 zinc ribbon domain-containing protein [Patescibacteria group bacterium]
MIGIRCEACGLPMDDETRRYCEHCAKDEAGQELGVTKEQAFEGIKNHYFMETLGLSEEEARAKTEEFINTLPAWQEE